LVGPSNVEFIPRQILSDFPKLNGLIIQRCSNFRIVKNDLLSEDFRAIEYLELFNNSIETVEATALQHLRKLKWINLNGNQIQALPFQIFQNNPEIITPDLFKNLNKLQHVNFGIHNRCVNRSFGCYSGSCSVNQSQLDSGLLSCYNNCFDDALCASKSGKLDNLSPEAIEKKKH
jgi:hypothetical protein